MIKYIILFNLLINISNIYSKRLPQFDINGQQCCANCLSRPDIIGDNDSLSFDKCSKSTPNNCCYENNCHMSLISNNFIFNTNIKYENNTPFIKQGNWIQFQWDNIEYITYIFINENQLKEIQPTNTSLIILPNKNNFQLCLENIGELYFRGWLDNGCIASIEYKIKIIKDKYFDPLNTICNNIPKVDIVNNCNLNRASLINSKCVCVSGFSNPPLCDKEAIWKILAIVMTSISAFLSISCLLYTFYSKKKKEIVNNHFHFDSANSLTHPNSRYNH